MIRNEVEVIDQSSVKFKLWLRMNDLTYSSLDELQGSLVLADLEQLAHSLLVWLETRHLTDEVADELAVLVDVAQTAWSGGNVLGYLATLVGTDGDLIAGWQLTFWLDHFLYV